MEDNNISSKDFTVYTYQFQTKGIAYTNNNWQEDHSVFSRNFRSKQDIFERWVCEETNFINKDNFLFKPYKIENGICVFQMYNIESFESDALIVIDNRPNRQQIAIRSDSKYRDSRDVAKYFEEMANSRLASAGLGITVRKRYEPEEFWSFLREDFSKGITRLQFFFDPRNLPWLSDKMAAFFDMSDEFDGTTNIDIKAKKGGTLRTDGELLPQMVDLGALSGTPIVIFPKGGKSAHTCGNNSAIVINMPYDVYHDLRVIGMEHYDRDGIREFLDHIEIPNQDHPYNNPNR